MNKAHHTLKLLEQAAACAHADHAVVLANSLSAEDMLLTDLIVRHDLPIKPFVLDTGRLHAETISLLHAAEAHYGITINTYQPLTLPLTEFVAKEGHFPMYESVALRKACCEVRKIEPLRRALAGKAAWVTGLRSSQSVTREDLPEVEWDAGFGLHKFNPLLAWSETEVWDYIKSHQVPYNPLHDKGYPSIGCEPCTRAIRPGEDVRAGRWWWESADKKECGLHIKST
jgi:phosphoadenosine phosphosulfate reductase